MLRHVDLDPGCQVGDRVDAWRITEYLHLSRRSTVVLAVDDAGQPVVLKFLRAAVPSVQELGRFRYEFEIARRFAHPHILRPERLGSHAGRPFMVLPLLDALCLRDRLRGGVLDSRTVLRLAAALVDALQTIHARGVVHRDIGPGNILLLRGDDAQPTLIDFGLAAETGSERPLLRRADVLEGSLATLAPEQSGRMSRDVDHRADFYSLGATLFEALTGEPVFAFNDAAQAVHAHLALPAPLATARRPGVFAPLAAVIAHCLHKEPEARYQSHAALQQDLALCLAALDEGRALPDFAPGRGDRPSRFQLSGRLYGQSAPLRQLAEAFEAAAGGSCRLVAVAGFSGIGKTALVNAAHRSLLAQRGNFAAAKFNQFGQHAPYGALLGALAQRAAQIEALPPERQQVWRERLAGRLGIHAAVVAEAIPEFRALLPELPPAVPLGPAETENRFLRTLSLCLAALAREGEPQTLFLDDLQWADRASRRLLREWAVDAELRHTLIVIAYRDNEVGPDHPLAQDLAEFAEQLGTRFLPLAVAPLALASTAQLLADSLDRPPADVDALAQLCQAKTAGNPFFLRRFVEELVQRRLIRFDAAQQRWDWSLDEIAQSQLAENVVALMLAQLQALPAATRQALTVAAFLGAGFDLQTLATALQQPAAALAGLLLPALQAQLLVPGSSAYRYAAHLDPQPAANGEVRYAFAHDRVQEAAYRLVEPGERARWHLDIGRLLRSRHAAPALPFEVVNHLNAALALIDDPHERQALGAANEQASQQALKAAAFDLAADYAAQAIALLPVAAWDAPESSGAALRLHRHAARMAYLAGRGEGMEALLEAALAHVDGGVERARLLEVRIEACYAQGRLTDTLDLGLQMLALLGAELPQAATPQDVVRLIGAARDEIAAMGLARLAAQPPMEDAHILLLMSISAKMTAAAYIARPALLPLLTVFQVRLMMTHGQVPGALSAYSVLGLMWAEFLGDYRTAHELGRMSMDLVQRHGWQQVYAHAGFSFNAFLQHWAEPLAAGLPGLLQTHHNGLEFGNLRHAGLGLYVHDCHAFLAGQPLGPLAQSLGTHLASLRRMRQPVAADYESALLATVQALRTPGPAAASEVLESAGFSGAALAETYRQRKDLTGLMFLHAWRALLHFLAERHAPALAEARAAAERFAAARGMHAVPLVVFIGAMSALRTQGAAALDEARDALARLQRWNAAGPGTFGAKLHLLAAEMAFAAGTDPLPDVEAAIASANRPDIGTPLDAALAQRAKARHLAALRPQDPALPAALAQARLHLLQWGATGVAQALQPPGPPAPAGDGPGDAADVSSLMKAVQAITAQAELPQLLQRLLQVVAENAGAQRAAIVLARGAQPGPRRWALQADARPRAAPQPAPPQALENLALEAAGAVLPLGLVQRVLATGRSERIDDARSDAAAAGEPYFRAAGSRSALSVALVKQGETVGAVYLENASAAGVFTARRAEFLELLCAHVVNAVDNARLVAELQALTASLERRVEQRTLALRESEARLSTILDNAPVPMTLTRRSDGMLVYANEPAGLLAQQPVRNIIGRPARSFYRHPQDRLEVLAKYQSQGLLNSEEVRLLKSDGSELWVLVSMVPVLYNDELADLSTIVDITPRKAMELELQRMATTDSLTGAANRRSFIEQAGTEIARSRRHALPMALVMMDLDHFKSINDRLGHAGGDAAIRAVFACCSALVRGQDVVGRLGGEEFALLLPQTDLPAARALAERLCRQIAAIVLERPGHAPSGLTASFGVAVLQPQDQGVDELLSRADEALYAAKRAGRNRVVCHG